MMNAEREQFEQRLSHQPWRPVPAEWRAEILSAAGAAPSSRHSSFVIRHSRLSALLWPHPAAWAGLAAVWIMILGLDISTHERATAMAAASPPASTEVLVELKQQQRLMAELMGSRDTRDADRARIYIPQPRSELLRTMAG